MKIAKFIVGVRVTMGMGIGKGRQTPKYLKRPPVKPTLNWEKFFHFSPKKKIPYFHTFHTCCVQDSGRSPQSRRTRKWSLPITGSTASKCAIWHSGLQLSTSTIHGKREMGNVRGKKNIYKYIHICGTPPPRPILSQNSFQDLSLHFF